MSGWLSVVAKRGHFARGASANANVNVGECRSTHKSGATIGSGYGDVCDATIGSVATFWAKGLD